jgi:hypothetical protein
MSYHTGLADPFRIAGTYVGRILKAEISTTQDAVNVSSRHSSKSNPPLKNTVWAWHASSRKV